MLRITETDVTVDGTKLRLDGKMAGPWVPVLKLLCDPILAKGQQIQVDCVGVSSLDNDGIALLQRLQGEGVTLVNCSAFIKLRLAKEYRRGDEEGHMKTIRFLVFRALLLVAFIMSYLYFLSGQERGHVVPIVRNVAWNDLVTQIKYMPDDSQQESLFKEVLVIQKFLSKHATEESVTDYDIAVFRAIDQVRDRLQKADKDLETIRKELSYREQEAKRGR